MVLDDLKWGGVFKKRQEIVSRKIAGEMILVPISGRLADMQKLFSLTSVGEYIWDQLDGKKSLREISDSIHLIFDVRQDEADADVLEFINELLEQGLITGVN